MSENLDKLIQSTEQLVARARLRLFWETYAPVLAPGFLALSLFIIGAWLGVWQWIGDPVRLIALIITLFFLARSVLRALQLRIPTHSDARRRVEQDSQQNHRPLDVLEDRPALSADVWPAHQKQALRQAEALRPAEARPALSLIDPYYLRFIIPAILFLIAIYMAGFSFERLRNAVSPNWQSPIRASQVNYEAWIDPPAYTGRPPVYFKDGTDVAVPAGSKFVARISGVKTAPRPRLVQGWRARFLTPKRLGAKSFEVTEIVDDTARVEFRVGLSRKSFALNVTEDMPPEVDIVDPPEADKRDRLTLVYALQDDFGVEKLQLEMALLTEETQNETAFAGVTVFADIPMPGTRQTKIEGAKASVDLSKTQYAGRKVIGRLVATDGSGQSGISDLVWFTVPDKIFVEPLAKAVAEQRSLVMAGLETKYAPEPKPEWIPSDGFYNEYRPRLHWDRAPAPIQRATLLIEAISDEPAGLFKDPAVYMGLRHVRSQMRHAESTAELKGLPEDLWQIALRAEFGILGSALEEMREAESALREGIARRAAKREVDTLFERYNSAVDAYTEELRRKAQEEGNVQEGSGGGGPSMGSVDEIQELLKAIEEANAAGDTEGARLALAQLAELLENMQIQLAQGSGGGGGGPAGGDMSEEEKKELEDLADLTGKQRDLQDETEQAERNDDAQEELDPLELARRQAEIRDLLDKLGETIPAEGPGDPGAQGEDGEDSQGQEGSDGDSPDGEGANGDSGGPSGTEPGDQAGEGTVPGEGEGQGQGERQGENQGQGSGQGGESKGRGAGGTGDLREQYSDGIGAAERAMRRSEEALGQGDLAGAGQAQQDAIQALREAGEALAEAVSGQDGEQGEGEGNDPLGRSDNGFEDGNNKADIDERDNATRSRELLEELRRRAAEQQRESEEREYLERLLERF